MLIRSTLTKKFHLAQILQPLPTSLHDHNSWVGKHAIWDDENGIFSSFEWQTYNPCSCNQFLRNVLGFSSVSKTHWLLDPQQLDILDKFDHVDDLYDEEVCFFSFVCHNRDKIAYFSNPAFFYHSHYLVLLPQTIWRFFSFLVYFAVANHPLQIFWRFLTQFSASKFPNRGSGYLFHPEK